MLPDLFGIVFLLKLNFQQLFFLTVNFQQLANWRYRFATKVIMHILNCFIDWNTSLTKSLPIFIIFNNQKVNYSIMYYFSFFVEFATHIRFFNLIVLESTKPSKWSDLLPILYWGLSATKTKKNWSFYFCYQRFDLLNLPHIVEEFNTSGFSNAKLINILNLIVLESTDASTWSDLLRILCWELFATKTKKTEVSLVCYQRFDECVVRLPSITVDSERDLSTGYQKIRW